MSSSNTCNRCGSPLGGYTITIYNADMTVKEVICRRCDANERKETYLQTGRLDIQLIMDVMLRGHAFKKDFVDRVLAENAEIDAAVHRFEEVVWYHGGLHSYVRNAHHKGHSMDTSEARVLLYAMAGRVMITLRNPEDTFELTVITAEDETQRGVMGLQSVSATKDEAIKLLDHFTQYVKTHGIRFEVDNEVSLI